MPYFFFLFGFYCLSSLFHTFWDKSIVRGGENGRSPRKTTWPATNRTWLVSHVTELGSNKAINDTHSYEYGCSTWKHIQFKIFQIFCSLSQLRIFNGCDVQNKVINCSASWGLLNDAEQLSWVTEFSICKQTLSDSITSLRCLTFAVARGQY